jgi:hypothetical protein
MGGPEITAIGFVLVDAVAHLLVPSPAGRDVVPIEIAGDDEIFGKAGLARTGATEDEGDGCHRGKASVAV